MRSRSGERNVASQVTTGVVLIVIGLLLLGNQRWSDQWMFARLWPAILLVLGVGQLFGPRRDGRLRRAFWLIFLGGLFLLHTHDVFTLRHSWPLFIVAGGISLILGGVPPSAPPEGNQS